MADIISRMQSQFKDKKVLVVGLGLQGGGVGLVKFFLKLGSRVKVTDKKNETQLAASIKKLEGLPVSFKLGTHDVQDFLDTDFIIKAPKMRWDDPLITTAQQHGVDIEMETSLFAANCPAPIIGITGTRGKSTTTMMIYEVLKKMTNRMVYLAGNLPDKLAISYLENIKSEDLVVLELSSWQLSGFHRKKISPHIAVFTNFYPDHLDYYKSMEEYLHDKKAIYLYQSNNDHLVINQSLSKDINPDSLKSSPHFFSGLNVNQPMTVLKGFHNKENFAAALEVTKILNLDLIKSTEILNSFRGLPFRQEIVRELNGTTFVNDTTSTTPTATVKAIDAFKDSNIVLILGGNSKNLPTDELVNRLIEVKKIVLLKGSLTDEIQKFLSENFADKITGPFDNLELAVKKAYEIAKGVTAQSGKSVVLFSPAATSFAMFNNEFHRGDEFNRTVKSLL